MEGLAWYNSTALKTLTFKQGQESVRLQSILSLYGNIQVGDNENVVWELRAFLDNELAESTE